MKIEKPDGKGIPPEWWENFFQGNRLACARLITKVENTPDLIPEIRDKIIPRQRGAMRIGITGPPGVGKSTVTAALALRAAEAGHSVGILAVDPSSPFTGGAFLGDRVRMHGLGGDRPVFIRSLASREGHGGISPATPHAADILDAFGLDRIFIETVGVGQAELDVLSCADLIILVLQPGAGDIIQALKTGIFEVGDIFLVNKADLPGLETLLDSLNFLFEIHGPGQKKSAPPIFPASAVLDRGLDEVYAETERQIGRLVQSGRYQEKRRLGLEHEIKEAIRQNLWERFSVLTKTREEIRAVADDLVRNRRSPYPYIRRICAQIKFEFPKEKSGRENGEH